jgi:hypothetical protein
MDPADSPKNSTDAHVEEVSGELGDYEQVVAEFTIDRSTWNAIRNGLKSDMKTFLDWINDTIID